MNNSYYETLDKNFEQALKFYEENYTHNQLIDLLKSGSIAGKQIAALRLDGVFNKDDAKILMSNLTGQDGKIREAVSLKISEFMTDDTMRDFFIQDEFCQVFLDAVIDINSNICRNIICAVVNLRECQKFINNFCPRLVNLCFQLLDCIEKFDFQEGKYKVNKEVFKLYWCLEAVYELWDKINFEDLKNIILRSKCIQEYTIREKAAKILSRGFDDIELNAARDELKNDTNYYVRRF